MRRAYNCEFTFPGGDSTMHHGHRRTLLAVLACGAASLAGCKVGDVKPEDQAPLISGYTCCNFHHEKDWINDGNYAQLPMIPAGSPIKVTSYGSNRAHVEIEGKPYRLGHDYGREQETLDQWVRKLVVDQDPKVKLATYPPAVRKAVQSGQIMIGMTKEQVIMAVGHPLTNENPRLDAPLWRYWWSSFGEYQVHWNGDRVSKVTGHEATVALMLAPGNAATAPASATTTAPATEGTASATAKKSTAKKATAKKPATQKGTETDGKSASGSTSK